MTLKKVSCRNCKWSDWVLTKNGHINPRYVGKCTFEAAAPKIPWCSKWSQGPVMLSDKIVIFPDGVGIDCPCFEEKE